MEKIIEGLFFAYCVLFPFGQLTRIPIDFISREVHLYFTDIVLFLLLLSWGIWRFFLMKKKYRLPPLALPIFIFSIFCLLSLQLANPLLTNKEIMIAGLYFIRWVVYTGIYFVVFDSKNVFFREKNLLNLLVVMGFFLAIFGYVQYFLYPDLKPLETLEWDPHYYRLVSTFLDPGFTGLILVLTLIVLVNLFLRKKNNWLLVAGIIIYLALILTHSRSSYLAFLVGMGITGIFGKIRRRLNFLALVLFIFGFSLLFLPQPKGEGGKLTRTYTLEYRFQNWRNAVVIIRDNPLFGVGFNAYRYAQRKYGYLKEEEWQASHSGAGVDSSLLFVFATTGIFGFLSYLWLLIKMTIIGLKQRQKLIGTICLASLGAIVIHSFFLNSLFYPWTISWLMMLWGNLEG